MELCTNCDSVCLKACSKICYLNRDAQLQTAVPALLHTHPVEEGGTVVHWLALSAHSMKLLALNLAWIGIGSSLQVKKI